MGKDADLVIVDDENLEINIVIANGNIVVENGKAIIESIFV